MSRAKDNTIAGDDYLINQSYPYQAHCNQPYQNQPSFSKQKKDKNAHLAYQEEKKDFVKPKKLPKISMQEWFQKNNIPDEYFQTINQMGEFDNDLLTFLETTEGDIEDLCKEAKIKFGKKNVLKRVFKKTKKEYGI